MIRAYIGLLGYGKTLTMVRDCIIALKSGRRVISNTPIKFDHKGRIFEAEYIQDGSEFQARMLFDSNCIFAVDEAAIVFPSYFWNRMSMDFLMKFAQARKYNCDFLFTTQGFQHSLARLRDLTNEVYKCRPVYHFFQSSITWKGYQAHVLDPEFFHSGGDIDKIENYLIRRFGESNPINIYPSEARRIYKAYDTMQRVDNSLFGIQYMDLKRIEKEMKIPYETLQKAKRESYPFNITPEDIIEKIEDEEQKKEKIFLQSDIDSIDISDL